MIAMDRDSETKRTYDRIATQFMLKVVQHWNEPEIEKQRAMRDLLDAANFTDHDSTEAKAWLANLQRTLIRGEFNHEVRQIVDAITERNSMGREED